MMVHLAPLRSSYSFVVEVAEAADCSKQVKWKNLMKHWKNHFNKFINRRELRIEWMVRWMHRNRSKDGKGRRSSMVYNNSG